MKHVIVLTAAAITLAGCQQSVDQQFAQMCAEQKSDPSLPQIGDEQCRSTEPVAEETKKFIVKMYHDQRSRVGR